MDALQPRVTPSLFIGDADAGPTFYYGVARQRSTWEVVANCQHRHRTREAAEKCGDAIADTLCDPVAPTAWRA